MLVVCIRFDTIELFNQFGDEFDLCTAKANREQFVQLTHALARLLRCINITVDKIQKLLGNLRRNLHPASNNNARNIFCSIRNFVLNQQQLQQILSRDGHEQTFR